MVERINDSEHSPILSLPLWPEISEHLPPDMPDEIKRSLKYYYQFLTEDDVEKANTFYEKIDLDLFEVYPEVFDNMKNLVITLRKKLVSSQQHQAPSSN